MPDTDVLAAVDGVLDKEGSLEDIKQAVANGGNVNSEHGNATPLLRAVQECRADIVQCLLECKADPDKADPKGVGPLHMAIFDGMYDVVQSLIDAKANVNKQDRHGQTPLFFAPHRKACAQLGAANADVNAVNEKGQSALHLAAHAGLNDAVLWLAENMKPATINVQDRHGRTAVYCAAHSNLKSTILLLQEHGADVSLRPHKYSIAKEKSRNRIEGPQEEEAEAEVERGRTKYHDTAPRIKGLADEEEAPEREADAEAQPEEPGKPGGSVVGKVANMSSGAVGTLAGGAAHLAAGAAKGAAKGAAGAAVGAASDAAGAALTAAGGAADIAFERAALPVPTPGLPGLPAAGLPPNPSLGSLSTPGLSGSLPGLPPLSSAASAAMPGLPPLGSTVLQAPKTELTEPVPAGSTVLPVADAVGFAVGDPIFIESEAGAETNAIKGFGSIQLAYPLQFSHPPGTKIGKIPPDDPRVKEVSPEGRAPKGLSIETDRLLVPTNSEAFEVISPKRDTKELRHLQDQRPGPDSEVLDVLKSTLQDEAPAEGPPAEGPPAEGFASYYDANVRPSSAMLNTEFMTGLYAEHTTKPVEATVKPATEVKSPAKPAVAAPGYPPTEGTKAAVTAPVVATAEAEDEEYWKKKEEEGAVKIQTIFRGKKTRARVEKKAAAAPITKEDWNGATVWEVVLTKNPKANNKQKYGFSHSNAKTDFLKEYIKSQGSSPESPSNASLALPDGPEALVVKKVGEQGLLEEWNFIHEDAPVGTGDRIFQVNDKTTIAEMQKELRSPSVTLKVMHYPPNFTTVIEKRPGARRLGFKFEKPQNASLKELKITEVTKDGLLDEVNRRFMAEGLHHMVVFAGMRIEAANEVTGDGGKIAEELRKCEKVSLKIRRAAAQAQAKMKVQQQMKLLSAFGLKKFSAAAIPPMP